MVIISFNTPGLMTLKLLEKIRIQVTFDHND